MDLFPSVSVVIANRNGVSHLKESLGSLEKLNYPKNKLEVIVVDNASTDGSSEFIRSNYSWVKVIHNTRNEGFARPSNQGARYASGEFVAFLNNDMRVKKQWLVELVNSLRSNHAQCAGSVIQNWDGKLLDFAGGSINFFSMGYQFDNGEPMKKIEPTLTQDRDILFACGGAMIIDRKIFLESGGFDEDYFAYFEDVDLGWRLHVLGCRVVLSVKSRVFHRHQSTGARFGAEKLRFLYERNKLYTLYKNYSDELLGKILPATLLLDGFSFFEASGIDSGKYEITVSGGNPVTSHDRISATAAAEYAALRDFAVNLPVAAEKRKFIQSHRQTPDSEIIAMIPEPFKCLGRDPAVFQAVQYNVVKTFGIDTAFKKEMPKKILLVASNNVGSKMTGPAIRYYEIAKILSKNFDVTLASFGSSTDIIPEGFKIINYDVEHTTRLIEEAYESYVVIIQGFANETIVQLREVTKNRYLVFDLYDPYVIENMEQGKNRDLSLQKANYSATEKSLAKQLRCGDFFLCADDAQKDYWLGMLSAYGRITPETYQMTDSGRKYIANVPFGLPDTPPVHTRNVLKGVFPGINKDDKVLIWGGGVWNWFDPLTLIRAVALISKKRSDVKLFFMGVRHPDPAFSETAMLTEAIELAKQLGIYDKYVFFNFNWVDYEDRQNYLLEADIGVSCHFETLETRFSFRTRVLDYLWAGLPIVCTEGDHFAKLVEKEKLGSTAKYKDAEDLAGKITGLLDDGGRYQNCRENVSRVAQHYRWSEAVKPIIEFCSRPRHLSPIRVEYFDPMKEEDGAAQKKAAPEGSVLGRLNSIEHNQELMTSMIEHHDRSNFEINEKLEDIQTWTYIMNRRFNLVKKYINPVNLFKRIFRRH